MLGYEKISQHFFVKRHKKKKHIKKKSVIINSPQSTKGVFSIMFQQNLTTTLLGIANVFVDKIENNSSSIQIHLSTPPKPQVCPF